MKCKLLTLVTALVTIGHLHATSNQVVPDITTGAAHNSTAGQVRYANNTPLSRGAIYSLGPIVLTDTEFGGNKGGGGGALYPRFGVTLTITGCNFHDNQALNTSGGGNGGAILLWYGPQLTVSGSTFTNNTAQ